MRLRQHLYVYLFYLGLAVIITFPLVLNLSGQLIGHHTSDAYEMGHHIWWFKYALQNGQPLFYQTLMAYPDGIQGISLWSNPLQFFPSWLFAFVMPVAAAYNLQILLTMALNGWAMFALIRTLTAPQPRMLPAVLAGTVFMSFPVFQGHLFGGHAGLMVMWGVPLLVLALHQLVNTRRLKWFGAAVVFFLLSPSGHTLQMIYVVLPLMGVFLLTRLFARDWRGVLYVIGVGVVGLVLLILFLLPVVSDTFGSEAYTGSGGYVPFSADLLGLVTPSFEHILFGQLPYTRAVLGINLIEGLTYVGMVAAALVLIAVVARPDSRWWLALAALAAVLALGPVFKLFDAPLTVRLDDYESYLTSPFAGIYTLPGFSLARTPGRFSFTVALAVAALAGLGAHTLMLRWPRFSRRLLPLLMALIVFEYQSFWPFPTVTAEVPQAIADLSQRDDVRAVMDVPWGNLLAAKDGLYLQIWHEKPLIAGQVTRQTPVSPAKLTLLETTADPALLKAAGVDVIIVHKQWADDAQEATIRQLGEPYYEDERFALYNVPDTRRELRFTMRFSDEATITDQQDGYLYAPAGGGWYAFETGLTGSGESVEVRLDGVSVQRATAGDGTNISLPLHLETGGYYTVSLDISPDCPRPISEALRCRTVTRSDVRLYPLSGLTTGTVSLSGGFSLQGALLTFDFDTDERFLALDWRFETPPTDQEVRFIKVLDANGEQVFGLDETRHLAVGDNRLSELIALNIPEDAEAPLQVYAGWYSYPDLTRRAVQSNDRGAADGLIYLGQINN